VGGRAALLGAGGAGASLLAVLLLLHHHRRQLSVFRLAVVDDVGLAPQLLRPAIELLVESLLLEHVANVLAHVFDRRHRLLLGLHLRNQNVVVVVADVIQADENPWTEPFIDIRQNQQLPRHERLQALFIQAELAQSLLEGGVGRKTGADLLHVVVHLFDRDLGETVAVDLMEAQFLIDELLENPMPEVALRLPRLLLGQSQPNHLVDVRGKDRLLVDDGEDPIGRLVLAIERAGDRQQKRA
jgi:hypothetical protein